MSLYLLLLPVLSIVVALVGRWRNWSLLPVVLLLLVCQAGLLWWLPVGIFLVWAQSLQLICLFTFVVVLLISTQKTSAERLMGQVYLTLFSFFTFAVLLMPAFWQQAAMALASLVVLVIWFANQKKARINLGIAMISWFYTVMAMAMHLHVFTLATANIIGTALLVIALIGMVIFYYHRFWLSLWFFCFHLGLALLLLWAPGGSSGLAVLLHTTFFLVALMLVTLVQYFFQDGEEELLEYENGTMVTLGFWRILSSIGGAVARFRKTPDSERHVKPFPSHFSLAHGLLLASILLIWCMPPTVLFLTVFLLFSQIIAVFATNYLVLGLLALGFILFTILGTKRLVMLWLQATPVDLIKKNKALVGLYALLLLIVLIGSTFWLPDQFMDALQAIGVSIQA